MYMTLPTPPITLHILHPTIHTLHSTAEYQLSDFTYDPESELSQNITNAIHRNALALSFRGVSVSIRMHI